MTIGSFLIGLVLLIIVLKILTFPLKVVIRFVINSIVGGIVLGIFAFFGIIVTVEWWTVLLTGLFGIPGVVIAMIITMFI
jgi:inhibitor of the pro-sigma K processing machinery